MSEQEEARIQRLEDRLRVAEDTIIRLESELAQCEAGEGW